MTEPTRSHSIPLAKPDHTDTKASRGPNLALVSWHQLWLVRAAALAFLIAATGYIISLVVAIQGIQSITHMAFDPKVDKLMDEHLDAIKRSHRYRQETYAASLARVMPQVYRRGEAPIKKVMIEQWLQQAQVTELVPMNLIAIEQLSPKELQDLPKVAITWLDSATIKIRDFRVSLPKEKIRAEFQQAEELILRNRAIRANWTNEIQPTLITLLILIIVTTGLLVIGSVFLIFRQFKKNIDKLVSGFSQWSESDPSFRFAESWSGELKYLASRFNHMADEVEENRNRRLYLEKVASWQIIARKLAHEIKNPLTPIQMMVTQLVRRYRGDDQEFKGLLEDAKNIISEEVAGLRRMVDNFSQFAQMPQPKLESRDLVEVVRRVVELEKAGFPDHNITFSSNLPNAFAPIDDQLIRQVIINLIKNAAEAAEAAQTSDTKINVRVEEGKRNFYIVIQDNGPGIPKDLQNRIFEAYFTTKHTGPSPGMGLGLAVCQKVILEHGGDLMVRSLPGDTEFRLALPKAVRE